MDDRSEFLESLSLDLDGISRQIMSVSAFINIAVACAMGFLVLAVYLASSGRERRDKNLYMVIPVLSALMSVMMRVDGNQALSFLGIFGILSIVRFRSDITDQRGITFILFAVIEGVIVGANAYALAILAWLVVSAAILVGRYLFNRRIGYRLVARFPRADVARERGELLGWLAARDIPAALAGYGSSSEKTSKAEGWRELCKVELMLFPADEAAFLALSPELLSWLRLRDAEAELKRQE
jgi:hypothetical protein